jgi:hypothetical protein
VIVSFNLIKWSLIMPNSPIVNAGLLYANGLGIAKTAAKVISLAAGAARDTSNTNDIILSSAVSINGANVGANGVDVAVLVASSFYAVYVIGDSTDYQSTAGLLSLNTIQPNLPGGYDMYRRIGWVLTDGSANILQFWQYGNGQSRMYYYDVGISELSGGSSTTFAAIDIATSVPPLATEVLFNITFTPDGATEVAEFLPFGSSASNGIVQFGTGVAGAQVGMVTVPCRLDSGVPKVLYKVASGDTLTVLTAGYKDFLS